MINIIFVISWKYYRNSFKVSSQYLSGFTKLIYSAFRLNNYNKL